jgi:hypothetical protein
MSCCEDSETEHVFTYQPENFEPPYSYMETSPESSEKYGNKIQRSRDRKSFFN